MSFQNKYVSVRFRKRNKAHSTNNDSNELDKPFQFDK